MKYGWIALAMCGLFALPVHAENYGGFALGAAEFCEGAGESGFFGGDCLNPRFLLRGYAGHRFSDFVSLELSFDAILDPRGWFGGGHGKTQIDGATVGAYGLMSLPLADEARLFAGPGVGGSMVHTSWGDTRFVEAGDETWETRESSDTTFGMNIGWTAGVEFATSYTGVVRIQWQTWRSIDSDALFDDEFSANYLSISLRGDF
ncbi:outer membrane beta-barrel protein [Cellvibrio sp. PSBB006]|uniref:outer membrane beta-barrel protein n=1 Tax=Cellvibrio sp. PSBB006 TaxID=1987723 RepID=UPI000B3B5772|nr:outer membrane beta-barrel protein [Cellvibrio sp. PSBB006]ARU27834.1 hypothetical protein CBR65_10590 [Cellvibrio sp. PSBB006]